MDDCDWATDPSARDYECWDEEQPSGFCARCGFTLDDHHFIPHWCLPALQDADGLVRWPILCPSYCTGPRVSPSSVS
jgi:hypothetical protein